MLFIRALRRELLAVKLHAKTDRLPCTLIQSTLESIRFVTRVRLETEQQNGQGANDYDRSHGYSQILLICQLLCHGPRVGFDSPSFEADSSGSMRRICSAIAHSPSVFTSSVFRDHPPNFSATASFGTNRRHDRVRANLFSRAGRPSGRHGANHALAVRSKGSVFRCHADQRRFVAIRRLCPFRLATHKPRQSDTPKSFGPSR